MIEIVMCLVLIICTLPILSSVCALRVEGMSGVMHVIWSLMTVMSTHTYIVSRHITTGGNNKILCSPPPHISSSEDIHPGSLVATLPNPEQINQASSNYIYTKSTPNHIHHHYAPSVTLTHTTHIISSTAPTYAAHCHP